MLGRRFGVSGYSIRAQVTRARSPKASSQPRIAADVIWAAAAHAHRINQGEYYREPYQARDTEGQPIGTQYRRNRDIMLDAVQDNSQLTDQDRELGRAARDYHSRAIMMKSLKGTMSEFDHTVRQAVVLDDFDLGGDRISIAVIASQIRAYESARQLEIAMEGVSPEPVADIGAKIERDVTVARAVYSQNYGIWFITAVTQDRHAVFFSYRERMNAGYQCRIRGTVKAYRENSTQLNRIKVIGTLSTAT